jgi:branched-chain amino acid aminotransferase
MVPKVNINGEVFEKSEAQISVYDHGLLYGDGVFEGIRTYGRRIFELDRHLDRLWYSAKAIWLDIDRRWDKAEMKRQIEQTLRESGITEEEGGYIRVVVTRGVGDLGLDPRKCGDPQAIIIVDKIVLYPQEDYEKGLVVITASTMRNHPAALNPRIKSLNYLNNILAKIEGIHAEFKEALMLNHKGEVAECTGDNLFVVHGRRLLTPPCDAGILEGITRQVVMELAREIEALEVAESPLTRHDVYIADECFLTGTAAEVIAVVEVDNRKIGTGKPGPITRDLMERFRRRTRP